MNRLTITPVQAVCEGKRTINTLKRLVAEIRQWALETGNPELVDAMNDAQGLAVTVWSYADESLSQLSGAKRWIGRGDTGRAVEGIDSAMAMLHHWQDRGGAIGNCGSLTAEDLTGLKTREGATLPAQFASAAQEDIVDGVSLRRCLLTGTATLNIAHGADGEALRNVWPDLLDRLVPDIEDGDTKALPI